MYEVEWERAAYLIVAMIVSDAIDFYFLKFFFSMAKFIVSFIEDRDLLNCTHLR